MVSSFRSYFELGSQLQPLLPFGGANATAAPDPDLYRAGLAHHEAEGALGVSEAAVNGIHCFLSEV